MNDTITARDAIARARMITGAVEAQQLLERAAVTGDTELVDAIRHEARLRGWPLRTAAAMGPAELVDRIRLELGNLLVTHKTNGQRFNSVEFRSQLTPDGQRATIREFTNPLIDSAAELRSTAAAYAAQARDAFIASVTDAGTPTTTDTSAALLAEMRMTKAWDRIRATYRAGNPIEHLRTALANNPDPVTFAAIVTEGPTWVRVQTQDNTTDYDEIVRQLIAEANPTLRRAHLVARFAEQLATITATNVRFATLRLEKIPPTFATEPARTADDLLRTINYIDPLTARGIPRLTELQALAGR